MKMLKVTNKGGHNPYELLLNPSFIVSMEQDNLSTTKVIVFAPNFSMPKIFYISDGISLIEEKLVPLKMKMLRLQMQDTEHELLLNPSFIASVEEQFGSTKITLSCPDDHFNLTFEVPVGITFIEGALAAI